MDALVSVIIPVYKVEAFLDRCVESVVGQTYPNLEIILVDDGSPDTCPEKCDAWAKIDSRIRVIHKQNEGPGYARNSGIEAATGAFITFVDSDDYLSPDAVEVLLERIERDQSDLAVAQRIKCYPDGTEEPTSDSWMHDAVITKDEAMHLISSNQTPFPASTYAKLYRSVIFQAVRFSKLKTAEDTCALPFIVDQCSTISLVNHVVYYYYQRDTSIVHNMTDELLLDKTKALLQVTRFLLDHDYIEEARHHYNAALCETLRMKEKREAKALIEQGFTRSERRLLSENKTREMKLALFIARFPLVYHVYQSLKKG